MTETAPYEDDPERRLAELIAKIERILLQANLAGPKNEEELNEVLAEAQSAQEGMRDRRSRLELLERQVEAIASDSAAVKARLDSVERAGAGRTGPELPATDKILREGFYLKEQLSGPPTDDERPRFFMDAGRTDVPDGLTVLGEAISERVPPYTPPYTPSYTQPEKEQ